MPRVEGRLEDAVFMLVSFVVVSSPAVQPRGSIELHDARCLILNSCCIGGVCSRLATIMWEKNSAILSNLLFEPSES